MAAAAEQSNRVATYGASKPDHVQQLITARPENWLKRNVYPTSAVALLAAARSAEKAGPSLAARPGLIKEISAAPLRDWIRPCAWRT